MTHLKIKRGDTVRVLAGKDRGKEGTVLEVWTADARVIVENVNLRVKHVRPRREREKGSRVRVPAALPVSRVALLCPKCGKPTRVGYRIVGQVKERFCRKCQEKI